MKAKVSIALAKVSALKCLTIQKEQIVVWFEQIKNDIKSGDIYNLDRGFDRLLREKSFGGIDYAVFFEGAKINTQEKLAKIEKTRSEIECKN